jgi:hypothetical protein
LAKRCGFQSSRSRPFKDALRSLVDKGILKLHQSGWPSEARGKKNCHPKTVFLNSDIYEVNIHDLSIEEESTDILEFGNKNIQTRLSGANREQFKRFLEKCASCQDCKNNPVVYVTTKNIPLCDKHWRDLSGSDLEW